MGYERLRWFFIQKSKASLQDSASLMSWNDFSWCHWHTLLFIEVLIEHGIFIAASIFQIRMMELVTQCTNKCFTYFRKKFIALTYINFIQSEKLSCKGCSTDGFSASPSPSVWLVSPLNDSNSECWIISFNILVATSRGETLLQSTQIYLRNLFHTSRMQTAQTFDMSFATVTNFTLQSGFNLWCNRRQQQKFCLCAVNLLFTFIFCGIFRVLFSLVFSSLLKASICLRLSDKSVFSSVSSAKR